MNKIFTYQLLTILLIAFSSSIFAEGTHGLSPTADDKAMLLINDSNYGYFAGYDGPENSRLYFTVKDADEMVYFGFSGEYSASGSPQGLGYFEYRIKRKSDGTVVFGPFSVTSVDANLSTWEDAVAGPASLTTGNGYAIDNPKYQFSPEAAGEYYIEFSSVKYLGLWDITVANDGIAQLGRVWSLNWAFRTPPTTNEMPECVWSKEFNAALYSYTTDGFVSKVDFQNSGFQGLSFNVAFNTTGPKNTGNAASDRQSVANVNLTDNAGEHKIFLNEPDPLVFEDGICGGVDVADYFKCDGDGAYCIPTTASAVGLIELILDFNGNGVYDLGTEDVLLLYNYTADSLDICIPWDGLKGNGEPIEFGDHVNLEFTFFQGVQHWSVYDGEYLKNGFCVEVIRPICDPGIVINSLYWDDRNIIEAPGTNQPKDGRFGCSCQNDGCRTWNNFNTNSEDCSSINNNNTTGYGERTTLNTWWYASIKESSSIDVPILTSKLTLEDGGNGNVDPICQGDQVTLIAEFSSTVAITSIDWYGPNGLITSSDVTQLSLDVVGGGIYKIIAYDEFGCQTESSVFIDEIICPVDLELDKSVDNATPFIGDEITFTISVTNNGPGGATGVSIQDELPSAYSNVDLGSNPNASLDGTTITWAGLTFNVGETQAFTYSVIVGYGGYTNVAEITSIDEEDIDSTPNNGVDTDGDGDCSDDDGDEDDGDCVEIIPIPCAISATVVNVICDANNTNSIPEDDSYTFSVVVEGESTLGGWISNTGQTGNYNETFTFGPYSIVDSPETTIIFSDSGDPLCTTTISTTAPETCSNDCEILIGAYTVQCDDSGTPAIIEDDVFYVNIIIEGRNISGGWSSNGGNGSYGVETQLGPFLIAEGDFLLTIFDADQNTCSDAVFIEAPSTCSTDCSITNVQIIEVNCGDNGTPSRSNDDIFFATINVAGVNLSAGWTSLSGFSGNYNEPVVIGPFNIVDGNVTIDLMDTSDGACQESILLIPPSPCSFECEILGEVVSVECSDNGSPSIPGDDVYWVTVQMSGYNLGDNWQTNAGVSGTYDEPVVIGPFNIASGNVEIIISDADDNNCSISLLAQAPTTCSDQCEIIAEVTNVECSDLGEDNTGFDDEFVYQIRVTGLNLSDQGWIASDGTTGNYDEVTMSVPHLITETAINLTITDAVDNTCVIQVLIEAPVPEVTCPTNTDEGVFKRPVQTLEGSLIVEDSSFTQGDSICWLPVSNNGGHYYDMISFQVGEEVGEYEKFTFILYTDMEIHDNLIPELPLEMYDGFGALFVKDYMFDEPCCVIQSTTEAPMAIGESLEISMDVDVTGIVPDNYHAVMSFSVPLIAEEYYTLVTTTWVENTFGNYKWVVVNKEASPLEVINSDEYEFDATEADVAFRLTFFDMADDIDEMMPPMHTGMPTSIPHCGVDEVRYVDSLSHVEECEDAYFQRTFTMVDVNGNVTECSQEIVFHRPTLSDVFFPPMTVHFACDADYETDENGIPLILETGTPYIFTVNGIEELTIGVHENIGVGVKDYEENENGELISITREWTVVDVCSNDTLANFLQLIKFDNYEMPTMVCPENNHNCPISEDGTMLIPTNAFDCFASAQIPLPEYEGGCGDTTNFEITTEIFHVLEDGTELITTILPGGNRFVEGMELGDYVIHYLMVDFEGNTQELNCNFTVVDLTEPVAYCNTNISFSLSNSGQIFVPVSMIDNESSDNCGIDSMMVRRMYTRDLETCELLSEATYSDWGDYVILDCCDANQHVIIELRVVDSNGNVNFCWSSVEVVDNTLPYCFGLADEAVDCEILPNLFDANNTDQLQNLFGLPQVYDNCTAEAFELQPILNLSECGEGTITRRFLAIDLLGQESVDTFYQVVTLEGDLQYEIKFPKDAITDCIDNVDTLAVYHTGCDSIFTYYTDFIQTDTGGEACYRVQRTFHVINYCEWDGLSSPIIISRDEDCDGEEGEEDVWILVQPNDAFVDTDSLYNNEFPAANQKGTSCDGTTNPEGYWNTATSSGYWIYRQILEVYDTIAPIVNYNIPGAFCTDSLICTANVILEFTVDEACGAPLDISVVFDAFSDGEIDETNVTVSGDYPNYYLTGDYEIGEHEFIITVEDACNSSNATLSFEVVDCEIPAIDCQSGLLLNLEATEPNTDADGDGDIDEGAVEVWAYDLAGCNSDDCSGVYHFSVNRIGELPNENQRSLWLTCDDRYSISLEVYVWDSAYNPYRIQPDGSVGGANYDHCTVFILLQDPNNICDNCVDDLELSGEVYSHVDLIPIEGVEIIVTNIESDQMVTDVEGKYLIQDLELNTNYLLTPKLNEHPKQGVSTLDIIAIHRHILGQLPINSPYDLIAADVNRSGTITFLDIVELQHLLLGDITEFSQVDSWVFVDANYAFPEANNPWVEVYPEFIQVDDMTNCLEGLDFYGIKIGDVNGTAFFANEADDRDKKERYVLSSESLRLEAGETYELSLSAFDIENILGGQFELNFDSKSLAFLGIKEGVLERNNIGLSKVNQGMIAVSWENVVGEKYTSKDLLVLQFTVLKSGEWKDFISLSEREMKPEVYSMDLSSRPVVLSFETISESLIVSQNKPNPFGTTTAINYHLSSSAEIVFQVTDVTGRVVYEETHLRNAGQYEIILNQDDLPGSGVYYYSLSDGNSVVIKPMVLLK